MASSDAPLDLEKGSAGAKANSDATVDLERGPTGAKAAVTEGRHPMDPRLAMCMKVSLHVGAVLYVFYYIGMITLMVRRYGWDSWMAVLILSTVLVWVIWNAPKIKYDTKSAPGSEDDSNLTTGLIASKK
ncbi:unnamed protein product [Urochloa decumbens]|uniref:Uncharacterized protein n=1 Tax=Urochloa decumbens TaxID=240449 RepID=A0ABC9E6J3_9POAL